MSFPLMEKLKNSQEFASRSHHLTQRPLIKWTCKCWQALLLNSSNGTADVCPFFDSAPFFLFISLGQELADIKKRRAALADSLKNNKSEISRAQQLGCCQLIKCISVLIICNHCIFKPQLKWDQSFKKLSFSSFSPSVFCPHGPQSSSPLSAAGQAGQWPGQSWGEHAEPSASPAEPQWSRWWSGQKDEGAGGEKKHKLTSAPAKYHSPCDTKKLKQTI